MARGFPFESKARRGQSLRQHEREKRNGPAVEIRQAIEKARERGHCTVCQVDYWGFGCA
jgi:hypothetical protein